MKNQLGTTVHVWPNSQPVVGYWFLMGDYEEFYDHFFKHVWSEE